MDYLHLRTVHLACVVISISLFVLRYGLSLRGPGWRRSALLRIGPHVNDTVLLASAVWLCVVLGQYPLASGWLTAKVLALLLYIVAGSVALRRGRTVRIRAAAFSVSLVCIAYILGAALQHSPWSWLRPLL